MDYAELGFIRVAAVAPEVALADPQHNAREIGKHITDLARDAVSLAVFPELCLTGYSCEDLFFSQDLQTATRKASMCRLEQDKWMLITHLRDHLGRVLVA